MFCRHTFPLLEKLVCRVIAREIMFVLGLIMVGSMTWLTAGLAAQTPVDGLQSGEFVWTPQLAPRGPLVIVISLPAQRAYVYRNGVRIGTSTVSTGRAGHETPSGVFTILQKRRSHYSNRYGNAPMPFMQRLTWDGTALHAGGIPGCPASHGCVRMPPAFAEHLFGVTGAGTTVVIAAEDNSPPAVTSPGLFAPVDSATGVPLQMPAAGAIAYEWMPERSAPGPLTIVLSTHDKRMVVMRNSVEIGRSQIVMRDVPAVGIQAYILLEGALPESSLFVPDRPALRWMMLSMPGGVAPTRDLRREIETDAQSVPKDFARLIYDALTPGATVVVTDEPLQPAAIRTTLMSSASED